MTFPSHVHLIRGTHREESDSRGCVRTAEVYFDVTRLGDTMGLSPIISHRY
jgi:hypothetical protein